MRPLHDQFDRPLIVCSAFRSPEHNRAVGGAKRSKHMDGAAFDIAMTNHDPNVFEEAARAVGFVGFGFYREPRNNFMHIDLGPKRTWGSRWPVLTPAFTPEPPAQKPLAKSRTMKGGGAAGVATVGAAGVEMIRDAATETQAAVQPLIPYLDTLRWLFIAAALAGIAVTIYARLGRLEAGPAMIGALLAWASATPWALRLARWGAIALAILLFLLSIRRAGERAGQKAERIEAMEATNDIQRRMLDAAARRPRSRDELARRLRDGRF